MAARVTRPTRRARLAVALVLALGMGTSLMACTDAPARAPSPSHTTNATPSRTPTPTPSPPVPKLDPDGSAAENLAYFDDVNKAVLAKNSKAHGMDFIDALVAAGFTKADMQVTADRTTLNLVAQSIQFSVEISGGCLIGQLGAQTGYRSDVAPVLSTGKCLIGDTRPIT